MSWPPSLACLDCARSSPNPVTVGEGPGSWLCSEHFPTVLACLYHLGGTFWLKIEFKADAEGDRPAKSAPPLGQTWGSGSSHHRRGTLSLFLSEPQPFPPHLPFFLPDSLLLSYEQADAHWLGRRTPCQGANLPKQQGSVCSGAVLCPPRALCHGRSGPEPSLGGSRPLRSQARGAGLVFQVKSWSSRDTSCGCRLCLSFTPRSQSPPWRLVALQAQGLRRGWVSRSSVVLTAFRKLAAEGRVQSAPRLLQRRLGP